MGKSHKNKIIIIDYTVCFVSFIAITISWLEDPDTNIIA
jgi:hypothetical protein